MLAPLYIEEYVMSTSAHRMLVVALAVSMSALATPGFAARKCTGPKVRTVGAKATANSDIVDTAVAAGSFKTLAAALQAADLVETLKGKGPFTVFAPTDEAFAKLPPGTVEALLKDKEKLRAILTYHVVPGAVKAADVVKLDSAKTVQGQSVSIDATDDGVKVNDAKVVKADVICSNGVIHVIDAVLLPK
jgi:uncharacterized surface protein with fasciclin (FAS1) repeats